MTKLAGNAYSELHSVAKFRNREDLIAHDRVHLDSRARFAASMIERWGLITARPAKEGETASKEGGTNMTPAETVERAIDLAELAYAAFETKGWLLVAPPYDELVKDED